ncbi:MAG: AlpA family phage regulatory protein [Pseudomonadota bacterium]
MTVEPPALINMHEVCRRTSLSRSAINTHRFADNFPKEVRISEKRVAFVASEIGAWIEARIAERENEE